MSDMIETFQDLREHRREIRAALGIPCPNCRIKQPKREPTVLLPQQRCKVDGYRDPRPESVIDEWNAARWNLKHEADGGCRQPAVSEAGGGGLAPAALSRDGGAL